MSRQSGAAGGWIKSSRSSTTENCVELRRAGESIEVRDSKDPAGGVLRFTPGEFAAWLGGAKDGEFDHLA